MSRKDYEAIAKAIRTQAELHNPDDGPEEMYARFGVEATACRIADVLAEDNPRFDRERFLNAALGDQ